MYTYVYIYIYSREPAARRLCRRPKRACKPGRVARCMHVCVYIYIYIYVYTYIYIYIYKSLSRCTVILAFAYRYQFVCQLVERCIVTLVLRATELRGNGWRHCYEPLAMTITITITITSSTTTITILVIIIIKFKPGTTLLVSVSLRTAGKSCHGRPHSRAPSASSDDYYYHYD